MIRKNLTKIRESIKTIAQNCKRNPEHIKVVAVSKRFPVAAIEEALDGGQLIFGENYIQEAAEKRSLLKDRIYLHFIGNLQSNKAKLAVDTCDMIETVDRLKIVTAINKRLEQKDRVIDILVQVNVGLDTNKSGIHPDETEALLTRIQQFPRLRVRGLMTMPPFTADPEMARPFFNRLKLLSEEMKTKGLLGTDSDIELSMGMSHDYHIAIEEGATLIRIGTAIFGQRQPLSANRNISWKNNS